MAIKPISILPLVFFRVAFGLLMLFGTLRFMLKGWVEEFYIQPKFHFTYYGFGWIKPLSGDGMYFVFGCLALLCVCIVLGCAYRFNMVSFFLLFTYVELIDKTYYLNHYYFISLMSFLLIFLPLHRNYSVDAYLRPARKTDFVPRWTLFALRLQIGLVYIFAGIAKLKGDWLFHAMPLSIWLPANADFPMLGSLFDQHWFAYVMSWAGAAFDLTIPFFLWKRQTRPFAYVVVIVFHVMTAQLFYIGMFPWIMIVCTLVFFDEYDYQRLMGIFAQVFSQFTHPSHNKFSPHVREESEGGEKSKHHFEGNALSSFMLSLMGGFFLLQLIVPFRHYLYPGNVLWTEEGYRFAWNVMLVETAGYTTFYVTEPASGKQWIVTPSDYLTRQQEQQMSFQPDMILQFAHYLADDFADHGYQAVEVRAEAYVSLNGRPSRLLIDPNVNLAAQSDSLRPKSWILK